MEFPVALMNPVIPPKGPIGDPGCKLTPPEELCPRVETKWGLRQDTLGVGNPSLPDGVQPPLEVELKIDERWNKVLLKLPSRFIWTVKEDGSQYLSSQDFTQKISHIQTSEDKSCYKRPTSVLGIEESLGPQTTTCYPPNPYNTAVQNLGSISSPTCNDILKFKRYSNLFKRNSFHIETKWEQYIPPHRVSMWGLKS